MTLKPYEVWVNVEKNGKSTGWGYLIKADSEINAKVEALNRARCKAEAKNSKWKGAKITSGQIREAFSADKLHN